MATTFLPLRLRWYAASTGRLLLRRWQALLLALGVLAPVLFTSVETLAYPLSLLSNPEHGLAWRFGYLLALCALAVLWALMQREQIGGGGFRRFATALPLPHRLTRLTDLLVLALADSPLWLLLMAALLAAGVAPAPGAASKLANLLLLFDFALFVLLAQLAALERRLIAWLAVAALGLVCVASIGRPWQLHACALAGAAALVLLARPLPRGGMRIRAAARRALAPFAAIAAALGRRLHPALQISLGVLFRQQRAETIGKLLIGCCAVLGALIMMDAFDYDKRALFAEIIGDAVVALSFSGLYRGLQMAHDDAARFANALPLRRFWSVGFDMAAVTALGLPFFATLAGAMLVHEVAQARIVLGVLVSAVGLLVVLRQQQLYAERHAVVLTAMVGVSWCILTFLFLILAFD
jgi:hypothetical protein